VRFARHLRERCEPYTAAHAPTGKVYGQIVCAGPQIKAYAALASCPTTTSADPTGPEGRQATPGRLAAERFMIGKINDPAFVNAISFDQTPTLITRFRKDFPGVAESIRVLDRVALMTPENIHLNSFMYEPIVDMSDVHLKKLYIDVKTLA
jgi:hypothetical protein